MVLARPEAGSGKKEKERRDLETGYKQGLLSGFFYSERFGSFRCNHKTLPAAR